MLDITVYIGPVIVGAVMLISLLAFGIWGSRSIRESAENVLIARKEAAANTAAVPAPVVDDGAADEYDLNLLPGTEHSRAAADQPNDELVYGGFAQSFVEGEEIGRQAQPDYTEAISRIKADLDAEAARYEENVAESAEKAAASAGETLQTPELYDEADADDAEGDKGATKFFSAEEAAELHNAGAVDADLDADDAAAIAAVAAAEADARAMDDTADETIEDTLIITDPEVAMPDAKAGNILEETRLIGTPEPAVNSPVEPVRFDAVPAAAGQSDNLMPESPLPFGGKIAWLAVPGYKPSEVISALRLAEIEPANWTAGLTQAYSSDDKVFVSPMLDGWVLVIGKTLWRKADMNRSAENIGWLKDVGRMFGNACFFSSMKGLGNHGWVGIRDGAIVRAYGYSGELQELIWLVGEPTEEEIAVNPGFASEVQERRQGDFRPIIPDEKMVLELAARWSIDPTFARKQYPADYGFLGRVE